MTNKEYYNYRKLLEYNVATKSEIEAVRTLVGESWTNVLNCTCKLRTGYDTVEDFLLNEADKH